jgi:hypothetical protein
MLQLVLHPDSHSAAVARIEVVATRTRGDALALRYVVTGRIGDLRLPPSTAPARADGLWQHTCFEAFVRRAHESAYHEFNFAPSTQWAAYGFTGYRDGMTVANEVASPTIEARSNAERLDLQASLVLKLPSETPWRLALSAVIEETNGNKSYWALTHPPGKPDFHHADGFTLELPKASS